MQGAAFLYLLAVFMRVLSDKLCADSHLLSTRTADPQEKCRLPVAVLHPPLTKPINRQAGSGSIQGDNLI